MQRKPYRLICSAVGTIGRKNKSVGYAYCGWNPDHTVEAGRLPGSGSFLFIGLHAVRRAAIVELSKPEVHQVQIRTNQDRSIYIFNKLADGRISGYLSKE